MDKTLNVAIIGASGYTGVELIRLLINHPHVTISLLVAGKNAGKSMHEIFPHMVNTDLPELIDLASADFNGISVVFCCLPHATSQQVISALPDHITIIDLSADFRLEDPVLYEKWYGHPHLAPEIQKEAVYGLSEINKDLIKNARLIANPGCYPTASLLPLFPLLASGVIASDTIIVDAKSGISGAGRNANTSLLFSESNESTKAYNVGKHRHKPEIEQLLGKAVNCKVAIDFTPHIVPQTRGMLATIYVDLQNRKTIDDARDCLKLHYNDAPFVQILEAGNFPSTKEVTGSNRALIALSQGKNPTKLIIVSVIDNLVKGASGQAVQNMNIKYDFDESTGLDFLPVFP